ncbi:hypothetical protein ACIRPX_13160 [Streptomyces sp. NPDC101225]|uniref:hypothetical protein n=1 Tax=Streptomyces sp. NPDC101225 TaxID=3366135 RepID=UPI00381D6FFB
MRTTRPMLAAASTAAMLVLAGCGAGESDPTAAVPSAATGTLESLAAAVKCRPDIQLDTDEVRQAVCKRSNGKFILATFATDRGQREWINSAQDYGGFYLVGRKWAVSTGTRSVITALRPTLGGDMEIGADHSAHTG